MLILGISMFIIILFLFVFIITITTIDTRRYSKECEELIERISGKRK